MYKWLFLSAVVIFTVANLYGCVQPQQQAEAPKPEPQKQTVAPAPAATPAITPKGPEPAKPVEPTPPPEPEKPMKELVRNGQFRDWQDGAPVGWTVSNGEEVTGGNNVKAIALRPMENPDDWNLLQQKIAEPIPPGTKVRVSAEIRADNPEMAVLKFIWWTKEGQQFKQKVQTTGGKVDTVSFDVDFPDDASGVAGVQVLRRPKTEGELLVTSVSVKIPE